MRTIWLSKKLDFKKIGLFEVVKKVAIFNYELSLPSTMKVWLKVFHISLLEPVLEDTLLEDCIEVVDDEEGEFEVETILDSELQDGQLKYLIKWVGYLYEDNL